MFNCTNDVILVNFFPNIIYVLEILALSLKQKKEINAHSRIRVFNKYGLLITRNGLFPQNSRYSLSGC